MISIDFSVKTRYNIIESSNDSDTFARGCNRITLHPHTPELVLMTDTAGSTPAQFICKKYLQREPKHVNKQGI